MSRINQLLTCGVLAVAMTGCQSARSTTNQVMNWRPFGQAKLEETAQLAEKTEESASVELGEMVKSPETDLAAQAKLLVTPSMEEEKPAPVTPASAETAENPEVAKSSETAAPAESPAENSFADFVKAMEDQPQLTQSSQTRPEIPVEEKTSAVVEKQATPGLDKHSSEEGKSDLGQQVEALLAELQADSKPENEKPSSESSVIAKSAQQAIPVSPVQHPLQSEIQQTALEQADDAALVAYDLASFADSSISEISSPSSVKLTKTVETTEPSTGPQLNFEDWMKLSQTQAQTQSLNVSQSPVVVSRENADFPWALPNHPFQSESSLPAEMPVTASAEDLTGKQEKNTPVVSNEIISALEAALGNPQWENSDSTSVESTSQTSPVSKITSMLKHENHQIRLRGIRLAYEQRELHPELLDQVSTMLNDQNDSVRAHAASTLYHTQRADSAVVATLTEIVCSGDVPAAHLSAMFLGDMANLRDEVLPALKTSLLSTTGLTSMYVADSLLKHDPKSVDAVACLTDLMRHENVEVRWLTAHALGSVQGGLQPYAVEALRSGLRDIDPQVRATSALSLGGLGQASKVAIAELTFISAHGEDKVKDAAIIALECIQQ